MAHRIGWSARALADLEALADFIAQDSPSYASSVVRKVIEQTRTLSRFPRSGRVVPEFADDSLRELLVYSYRVIYRVEKDGVLVVAVVHGRRDLSNT